MSNNKSLVIATESELQNTNKEQYELVYCEDTKNIYRLVDNEWTKIEINNQEGLSLNLYELNKSVVSQLDPMTTQDISSKMDLLMEYFHKSNNYYHMLLCKDYNYYTIFNLDDTLSFPNFAGAVCTIISELGDVYSIEQLEDGAVEIWIKPAGEESALAFYLFPYDKGVVYYG